MISIFSQYLELREAKKNRRTLTGCARNRLCPDEQERVRTIRAELSNFLTAISPAPLRPDVILNHNRLIGIDRLWARVTIARRHRITNGTSIKFIEETMKPFWYDATTKHISDAEQFNLAVKSGIVFEAVLDRSSENVDAQLAAVFAHHEAIVVGFSPQGFWYFGSGTNISCPSYASYPPDKNGNSIARVFYFEKKTDAAMFVFKYLSCP